MLRFGFTLGLASVLVLFAGAGCGSSGGDDANGGASAISGAPTAARKSVSLDAPIAKLISATKGFNPTAPLLYPPQLPIDGLTPVVIADGGGPGGYDISFDVTPLCANPNGCGAIWLVAEAPNFIDGSKDDINLVAEGDFQDVSAAVGTGIRAVYDPVGGAHGNPSITWQMKGAGTDGSDFDYSINFDASAASFTKEQMIGFAKAAIAAGPLSPAQVLVKQLRQANPNFKPKAPIFVPRGLPVGGLFPTRIADAEKDGGYNISFDLTPTCDNPNGCGAIWISAEPPFKFDGETTDESLVAEGDSQDVSADVGGGVKAVYDPVGGAHGNPSITWGDKSGFDIAVNFAAGAIDFSKEQMVGFVKDALARGPMK